MDDFFRKSLRRSLVILGVFSSEIHAQIKSLAVSDYSLPFCLSVQSHIYYEFSKILLILIHKQILGDIIKKVDVSNFFVQIH
jgi:hypothetical protein